MPEGADPHLGGTKLASPPEMPQVLGKAPDTTEGPWHCPLAPAVPVPALGHLQSTRSVTRHSAIPRTLQVNISFLPLSRYRGLRCGGCLWQGTFVCSPLGLEGLWSFLGGRGLLFLLLFLLSLLLPLLLLWLQLWDQLRLLQLLLWDLLLLLPRGFLWWGVGIVLRGFVGALLPQVLLLLLGVAFLILAIVLIEFFLLLFLFLQIEIIILLLLPARRVLAVADGAVAGVVGVAVPLIQL